MHNHQMKARISHIFKICLIPVLLLMAPWVSEAQQTLEDASPLNLYNKGVTLFESTQYGAAQKVFKDFLASPSGRGVGGERDRFRIDAEYYIAISAMELFQDDAEALLMEFVGKYPEDPKAKLA